MKNLYVLFILIFFSAGCFTQQDPKAREILDIASEQTKKYTSLQANFELIISKRTDKSESKSEGLIKIKGEKYYLSTLGTEIYCNGETMWSYLEDVKEVTISEMSSEEEDFIDNPAKIFTWYNRDFKYRYVGEASLNGIWMHEIDLFPNNLNQPYSRFKVFINKETNDLFLISAIGKDGTDYSVFLTKIKKNIEMNDNLFEFDINKHKDVEVIDMRL
jgi:outer membrane lipoprotein-sorting protein